MCYARPIYHESIKYSFLKLYGRFKMYFTCATYIMVIEVSGVQFRLKSSAWFEITSMISNQNCMTWGSITTLLYPLWNHPITGLGQFKYFIDTVLNRFEIKFIHFGQGVGGNLSFGNKSCKICHMMLSVFHFLTVWLVTLKKPWNVIGCFVLVQPPYWLGKGCNSKQKMVWFMNKLHQLESIRLQGPPVISKWV